MFHALRIKRKPPMTEKCAANQSDAFINGSVAAVLVVRWAVLGDASLHAHRRDWSGRSHVPQRSFRRNAAGDNASLATRVGDRSRYCCWCVAPA
jgi:hypothetical protein